MKLLGYILAFCILFLSAVPCCAIDNCPGDNMENSSTNGEGKDCGNCSPFFSCEGCAAATISFEPATFNFSVLQDAPVYTEYIQQALPHFQYDFWQPPRLG